MSIKAMSDYVFYAKYAKYNRDKKRRETWSETVDRVFKMHHDHLKSFLNNNSLEEELLEYLEFAKLYMRQKRTLGSQRALQFGGDPILKHNEKIYNCSGTYIDRPRVFQEILYILLCGCGSGFSVQKHHIEKLPNIQKHDTTKKPMRWVIDDSIEGWADALGVLMVSYFEGDSIEDFKDLEINHRDIEFDYSKIRPEGAMINGGFSAPGPNGLKQSLEKIKQVIENRLAKGENRLHPIDAYDILMHASDAVLSGGIRRSAAICIFSKDDEEMLNAKTGEWFRDNPQRGRSNNSVALKRDECTKEEFFKIIESIKQFGEPGFYFAEDYESVPNPCCLVGDTKISTNIGSMQLIDLIDRVQRGENIKVLSYNIQTKQLSYEKVVTGKLMRKNAEILEILFDLNSISSGIRCTPDHKIYVMDKGYVQASELKIGDKILNSNLQFDTIESIWIPSYRKDVFDIEVENNHNFFANGILVHNCEISFNCTEPESQETGINFCNLCEINMKKCKTEEDFYSACKAAAIIGTIQASYTNFTYLTDATKKLCRKEALLGVSMTGMMDSPEIAFNPEIQKKGAKIIKKVNKTVAKLIGINPCARATCVKPSGNSSILLGSGSGIHPQYARRYIRRIQANVNEFPLKYFESINPKAVETSVWSNTGTDKVALFTCEVPAGSIIKNQLSAIELLEKVKLTQQNWVEYGTTEELCLKPYLRNNVSNTISVKPEEWNEVAEYLYKNRKYFTGVSLLSVFGDKDLPQTPITTVYTAPEIAKQYGNAAMFASGLIVHAQKAFGEQNLWKACNCVNGLDRIDETNECQVNWINRVKKFADRYFDGDIRRVTYLLKDVDNLKLWCDLNRTTVEIDWSKVEEPDPYVLAIDTTAAASCAGGKCEII